MPEFLSWKKGKWVLDRADEYILQLFYRVEEPLLLARVMNEVLKEEKQEIQCDVKQGQIQISIAEICYANDMVLIEKNVKQKFSKYTLWEINLKMNKS